jgi:hypothetical protein
MYKMCAIFERATFERATFQYMYVQVCTCPNMQVSEDVLFYIFYGTCSNSYTAGGLCELFCLLSYLRTVVIMLYRFLYLHWETRTMYLYCIEAH